MGVGRNLHRSHTKLLRMQSQKAQKQEHTSQNSKQVSQKSKQAYQKSTMQRQHLKQTNAVAQTWRRWGKHFQKEATTSRELLRFRTYGCAKRTIGRNQHNFWELMHMSNASRTKKQDPSQKANNPTAPSDQPGGVLRSNLPLEKTIRGRAVDKLQGAR